MPYVITFICYSSGNRSPYDGRYLKSYDASYIRPDGTYDGGDLHTTYDIREAQKFDNAGEALSKWKEQAPYPWNIRWHDGQPNRPLTAFTIEVKKDV